MEKNHINYNEIEKLNDRVSKRVDELLKNGEIIIIMPNHHSVDDFKRMRKILDKKKNKFLKSLRKYYGKPYEAIEEFEFILRQYEVTGILASQDVQRQRERFYKELNEPDEVKQYIEYFKQKGYI